MEQTCGQGLAENAELPGKLAVLIESVANVLDTHREALNPRDANSRREDEAYRELARRMEGYRDLPMGRHDEKVMSSPKAVQAFEKFVTLEGQVAALLQRRLIGDRAMLDQMRRAGYRRTEMFLDGPSFVDYWRRFRGRTMRILDLLPADDLEWTHAPGKYTFGDIFRHLPGIERYMYGETVRHRLSAYPGHAAALASGPDAVREYAERCHAESLEIFGGLTLEDLTSKCLTPSGTPITVWKWLRAMVEHEAHHRGQLYLMAGMRGISVPPLYGLTEEEVVSLSEPS